ncbi:MAG TPA: hypothetical protein VFZ53_16700, partial [Polyangiaceae bacterium]
MKRASTGAFLAIALGAASAHAADGARSLARLELASPADDSSCIGKGELERAVERRLRRKVFREPAALVVEVRVERIPNGWSAELVLRDAESRELGRRALDTAASDCSSLDASLALVVALLVDSPPMPPPPAEPSAPPAEPATTPARPEAPKPAPPTR